MSLPYTEKVLEHFRNPRNVGRLEDADGKAVEGSPACGDMVAVYIKVEEPGPRITDIRFESYGCASNIATGSVITEMAKGLTLEEARRLTWQRAAAELGGLPPVKAHCSVLAIEGLRAAIRDYEERRGLAAKREPLSEEAVRRRLRHVMDPSAGLDVVRTGLVREVAVAGGGVRIVLSLAPDHRFAPAIKEDILDKLRAVTDNREVVVEFAGQGLVKE